MTRRTLLASVAAASLLACGGSDNNTGPSTDLSGNYVLLSLQYNNDAAFTPPTVSGTLVLTATTYVVTLNTPVGQVADQGTYTVSGSTFSQSGTMGQATGTWAQSGTTFSTDLTSNGQRIRTSWQKQ